MLCGRAKEKILETMKWEDTPQSGLAGKYFI